MKSRGTARLPPSISVCTVQGWHNEPIFPCRHHAEYHFAVCPSVMCMAMLMQSVSVILQLHIAFQFKTNVNTQTEIFAQCNNKRGNCLVCTHTVQCYHMSAMHIVSNVYQKLSYLFEYREHNTTGMPASGPYLLSRNIAFTYAGVLLFVIPYRVTCMVLYGHTVSSSWQTILQKHCSYDWYLNSEIFYISKIIISAWKMRGSQKLQHVQWCFSQKHVDVFAQIW